MRKLYKGNAITAQTVLAMDPSSPPSGGSFTVNEAEGFPFGDDYFVVVAGLGEPDRQEKMLVRRELITSTTFLLHPEFGRGFDDSVARFHPPGEKIDHVLDADTLTKLTDHLFFEDNPHPQYLVADDFEEMHGTDFMRTDGTSDVSDITGTPLNIGTTNDEGSGNLLARHNHQHQIGSGAIDTFTMFSAPTLPVYVAGSNPPSPAEGQVSARTDTGILQVYDGSAHIPVVHYAGYTSYTPSLIAATTNPTLGSGSTAEGKWTRIGNTIHGVASLIFGTAGFSSGVGQYALALPQPVVLGTTPHAIGSGTLFDSSTNTITTVVLIGVTGQASRAHIYFSAATNTYFVANNQPWTWAASDALRLSFQYEV